MAWATATRDWWIEGFGHLELPFNVLGGRHGALCALDEHLGKRIAQLLLLLVAVFVVILSHVAEVDGVPVRFLGPLRGLVEEISDIIATLPCLID